ncbi:phage head closure protein [Rhizobium sp. TRM95111]|uniref:phage head closure protein n=1 Tax=Rhizobium alarense TaxID=2846851 RepID=UPI001F1F534C|nr:phage head closure protein [Rhizobium alarense]MCF3642633.1 phage head closure protein [Rhizobium alarense]
MATRHIDPGAFTARLVLERRDEAGDGQGGADIAFTAVASLWARIDPLGAAQAEAAGAERQAVTHRVWLRHRAGVEPGMRLRKGGRILTIQTVHDPDETGRYLVCDCTEDGQ